MIVSVDLSSLAATSSENVTGEIFFAVDGICFPEQGWNDFPIIIMGWWLEHLLRLLSGESDTEDFCFMDGPYLTRVKTSVDRQITLEFCRNGSDDVLTQHVAFVPVDAFVEDLVKVAKDLDDVCGRNKWSNSDTAHLAAGIGKLAPYRAN